MTLGEAVDLLTRRIKRPDKSEDAVSAINRAISLFATSTFAHDLAETTVTIANNTYVHAVDITASPFVRFRKIKYMRPTGYRKFIAHMDPSRVFNAGTGCEQVDVFYRAGNLLRFKLSALQSTIEVGYYQFHLPLVDDADTDWMLEQLWPAVEAYALAELHESIGNTDEGARNARRWPILLTAFKDDLGDGVSYG